MNKKYISTQNAPAAIGAYSQAVKVADTIYISGQIPLHPDSGTLVSDDFIEQAKQVFRNLMAIAQAADFNLDDAVKLTVYLTDLNDFSELNQIMAKFMQEPYPARAVVEVSALPRDAKIEVDAILSVG